VVSVVVVEDDPEIRRALVSGLTERGHAVASFGAGFPVLEAVVASPPDVVLLDLGLPDVDGIQLLAMLRAVSQVPVVVVTARDDESSIVRALDAGADDYVVKPFGVDHAAARIRAVLRRGRTSERVAPLAVGRLVVDPRTRTAQLAGRDLDLARKEFDLLLALASRAGEVVSKRDLLIEVWQQPYGGTDRTIDVHLSWLRRKLGETAAAPRYLRTVRGVGLQLVDPEQPVEGV
jgi:DNA-binding response OmpR family regulator